jgi:hypothetical protein
MRLVPRWIIRGPTYYMAQEGECSIVQNFEVSKSGILTFKSNFNGVSGLLPVVSENNKFGILNGSLDPNYAQITVVARESNGLLENTNFGETDPTSAPSDYERINFQESPDPTDHFAVFMINCNGIGCGPYQVGGGAESPVGEGDEVKRQ